MDESAGAASGGGAGDGGDTVRLGGSILGPKRHICALFHHPDDEYRVLLPFIKHGFEQGDLSRFSGEVVVAVRRTHPMVLIGGVLQENPFFVPPGEFLRELRERRAG